MGNETARRSKTAARAGRATLVVLTLATTVAAAQGTEPVPVHALNFVRAETDLYFGRTVKEGGFGRLKHTRQMTPIDQQDVVRMNRDTLYSSGVFDLAAGPITIALPEAGKRFMSMQVVSEDHYTVQVAYAPVRLTYTEGSVGTRYVFVIVRTLADPRDPGDMEAAHRLQDGIEVEQAGMGTFQVPKWDPDSQAKAREALLALGALGGTGERFGRRDEVDPISHLIGTVLGWGGNPSYAAIYEGVFPERNDGTTVHTLTVKDMPVDGFCSISLYNAKGYFEKNDFGAYSVNNLTAKPIPDGSATVQFGGCRKDAPNCLPIVAGWNYVVRFYRPRKELVDGTWKMPEALPVR